MKCCVYLTRVVILCLLCLGFGCSADAVEKTYSLQSPNGKLKVKICLGTQLSYIVLHEKDTLLTRSHIGLTLDDGSRLGYYPRSKRVRHRRINEEVISPFYRVSSFQNVCNELNLTFRDDFGVVFRAYNDGVAYRFYLLRDESHIIKNELAEFNFPHDPLVYLAYTTNEDESLGMAFQNIYQVAPLSEIDDKPAFLPATIDCGKAKVTILESALESYPGMFLRVRPSRLGLSAMFAPYPAQTEIEPVRMQARVGAVTNFIAYHRGAHVYPWRVLAITEKDTEMPVNNLVYALASPNRIGDYSWVKPGKAAWEWWNASNLKGVSFQTGLNTETYKYYIDFAAQYGLEYMIMDEGWYKPSSGDMLTVIPEINLPALVEYGRERGVGIILWTVFNVLDKQLEAACVKYAEMGIKGFKVDFLDRDDQPAVESVCRIAEVTARHKLILDFHGIYKPTGLNRTYPHILNVESVFGMEEVKWTNLACNMPQYDVTFPYIRMMAGMVDYTPGAMRNATRADWKPMYHTPASMGTRCHQLAACIVYDAPLLVLCDSPTNYANEPDCMDFMASIPTVPDATYILAGELGKSIVTARKYGDDWYVGGLTNWDSRDLTLDLSFLSEGTSYEATLFIDGVNADRNAEDYRIVRKTLTKNDQLEIHLASGGGFAMKLSCTPSSLNE